MDSIFTIDGIIELLEIVKRYIIYIYPGFLTLVIYRFAMYKSVEENKNNRGPRYKNGPRRNKAPRTDKTEA